VIVVIKNYLSTISRLEACSVGMSTFPDPRTKNEMST